MFDPIGRDDILALVEQSESPCVSLFMPTHEAGPETQQGPIRLKNLRKAAAGRLVAQGMRSSDVETFLEPLRNLEGDSTFWSHQSEGLALFAAPGFIRRVHLPGDPGERVVVGRRFHMRPLLAALLDRRGHYVLALSQARVRLIAVEPGTIREVPLQGVPTSLDAALAFEDPERQLRQRSGPAGTALFHGHGVGREEDKERISRFFRTIDPGIREIVQQHPAPVVLAAVDYLIPLYREVSAIGELTDVAIEGNPDEAPAAELAQQAWQLLEPALHRAIKEDADGFLQLRGTGRTGESLADVVPAAAGGRVEVLFVPLNETRWGVFDAAEFKVELHPARAQGDEDLLDTAAVQTWLQGGRVHVVDAGTVPGDGPLAAVYRY